MIALGLHVPASVFAAEPETAPSGEDENTAAEASAPVAESPRKKFKKPKLTLASADGNSSLTFALTIQMLFEDTYSGLGTDQQTNENDYRIRLRRVRPDLQGTLIDKNFSYRMYLNLAPGALEMMDIYIGYRFSKDVQLRFGVHKIPFTQYRVISFRDIHLVDWPITTKYFGSERQFGLTLHNGYKNTGPFQYEFGIYNGVNLRNSSGMGMSYVTKEESPTPMHLTHPNGQIDEIHPSFGLHLAYNHNDIDSGIVSDFEGGDFRMHTGFSIYWDPRAKAYRDYALRLAPELLMKCVGWSWIGLLYAGFYEQNGKMEKTGLANLGASAESGYLIRKIFEITARYALVYNMENFRHDAARRGTILTEQALSSSDPDYIDVLKQYEKAGQVIMEHEIGLGFNIYLLEKLLEFSTDFSLLKHEKVGKDPILDFRARAQVQVAI